MIEKFVIIFKICTYLALLPFVYRVIMAIDISKIFKRNHTSEIKLLYLFIIIIITKIIGDFLNDIMDLIRVLLELSGI